EEKLLESDFLVIPMSWSSDGKFLVYWVVNPNTGSDQWILPMTGDRNPVPFLQTQFGEYQPEISPDGKWIAYVSDETGRGEVYIRPFPTGAGRWQVSTNGGYYPRWRRDGKEVFFVSAGNNGKMMAAQIRVSGSSIQTDASASCSIRESKASRIPRENT